MRATMGTFEPKRDHRRTRAFPALFKAIFQVISIGVFVLFAACQAPARSEGRPPSFGLALSGLPNIGLTAQGEESIGRSGPFDVYLAGRLTQQWLDDSDFADDGFEEAGDWTQADAGLLGAYEYEPGHRLTLRFAGVWMRARGQPNLVDQAGDYFGAGVGVGLRTDIAPGWSFGPELLYFLGYGEGEFVNVPQLTWGFHWSPRAPGER